METNPLPHVAGVLLASSILAANLNAAVVYSDNLDGSSASPLNGSAPDVRPGSETWVASAAYLADGSFATGGAAGSAWLPFTAFQPDTTYTITLTTDISYASASVTPSNYIAFSSRNPLATANILSSSSNTAYGLLGVFRGGGYHFYAGPGNTASGLKITGANNTLFSASQDNLVMKVELTTSSSVAWTMAGYVNGNQIDLDASTGGLLYTLPVNPSVTGVGFSTGSTTTIVEGFEFAAIPEPASLGVLGLCGVALAARRRAARGR